MDIVFGNMRKSEMRQCVVKCVGEGHKTNDRFEQMNYLYLKKKVNNGTQIERRIM